MCLSLTQIPDQPVQLKSSITNMSKHLHVFYKVSFGFTNGFMNTHTHRSNVYIKVALVKSICWMNKCNVMICHLIYYKKSKLSIKQCQEEPYNALIYRSVVPPGGQGQKSWCGRMNHSRWMTNTEWRSIHKMKCFLLQRPGRPSLIKKKNMNIMKIMNDFFF